MKLTKALSLIAIMAFTAPAIATAQDKAAEQCELAVQIAEAIMQNRQAGTPISKMMEVADGNQAIIGLILVAYDTPRFSTQEYQLQAVTDFSNEVGLACYKGQI